MGNDELMPFADQLNKPVMVSATADESTFLSFIRSIITYQNSKANHITMGNRDKPATTVEQLTEENSVDGHQIDFPWRRASMLAGIVVAACVISAAMAYWHCHSPDSDDAGDIPSSSPWQSVN